MKEILIIYLKLIVFFFFIIILFLLKKNHEILNYLLEEVKTMFIINIYI